MRSSLGPVFIDANIPIYAAGSPHEYKLPCIRLMYALEAEEIEGIASSEVVQEVAQHYVGRRMHSEAQVVVRGFLAAMPIILPVEREDVEMMMRLLRDCERLNPRDAVHAAVMLHHGINTIITADRHFSLIPDLIALDPRDAAASLET